MRRRVSSGLNNMSNAAPMKNAAIGLWKKIATCPLDMINERRIAVSNSGPMTNPSTIGAGSIGKFLHQVADDAEDNHDHDVAGIAGGGVGADDAEQNNQWEKEIVGDLQHFDPQADQRQIEDQKHGIADRHAAEQAPENIRRIFDKQRSGRQAVDHQRAKDQRCHRAGRQAQAQQRDPAAAARRIICRLGRGHAFDSAAAEFFRMLGNLFFDRIGGERGDDDVQSGNRADQKAQERFRE